MFTVGIITVGLFSAVCVLGRQKIALQVVTEVGQVTYGVIYLVQPIVGRFDQGIDGFLIGIGN